MIADERRRNILHMIRTNGSARTVELAELFNVSDQTVRRDLLELEEKGLIRKAHGGGHSVDYHGVPFGERAVLRMHEKQLIAEEASRLISPGMTLVLSPGTTTEAIAHRINGMDLLVLTNSLAVTQALSDPHTRVRITGGDYRSKGEALTGELALKSLEDVFADMAFIGISGIDSEAGYTTTNAAEAAVARQFMRIAKTIVVVADSTKFLRSAEVTIAPAQAAHLLITDPDILPYNQQALADCGVEVVVAQGRVSELALIQK